MVGSLMIESFFGLRIARQHAFNNRLTMNQFGCGGHAQSPEVLLYTRAIVSLLHLHALSVLTNMISPTGRCNRETTGGKALPVRTHEKCSSTSFSWCVVVFRRRFLDLTESPGKRSLASMLGGGDLDG